MDLAEYIVAEHISTELKSTTKFQIIEELLTLLNDNGTLLDFDVALQDVLAREGYLSTGLESGLAIPHAKTDGVKGLQIALGIKKEGLDFESLDGKPANLIFLVLSPRSTSGPHIQTLAVISRNLKEKPIRDSLVNAKSKQQVLDIIKDSFHS